VPPASKVGVSVAAGNADDGARPVEMAVPVESRRAEVAVAVAVALSRREADKSEP